MKRRFTAAGVALVAALSLTACSGGGSGDEAAADGPITLTLSGWSVSTTPEFQALADAFHEKDPDVTVEVKEYDATNYDTLMTADLAAGSGPDIVTQKNVKNVVTYQAGGQLMDVSTSHCPTASEARRPTRSTTPSGRSRTARTRGSSSTTRTSSTRPASPTPTAPGPGTTTPTTPRR